MIEFLNFFIIAAIVAITSLGVALGNSISTIEAIKAIYVQPKANKEILKASLLGLALSETSAVIGFVMAILLIAGSNLTYFNILARIGIFFAICIPGFIIGLASAQPVKYACISIARQPFFSNKILNLMFLTLTFIQSPMIFGFIISLLINFKSGSIINFADSIRMISSGLSLGVGTVGPIIGLSLFAKTACQSIGINRNTYNKIFTFSFISQALLETPIVFALITSLAIITSSKSTMLYIFIASEVINAKTIGVSSNACVCIMCWH